MLSLTLLLACEGEPEVTDTESGTTDDTDTGGGDTDTAEETEDTETFTTPVGDAVAGNMYNVDAGSGNVVEPEGGDALLSMVDLSFYIGVDAISGSSITMTGVLPGDTCDTEFPLPDGDFSGDPVFSVGPTDAPFLYDGYELTLYQMTLTGAFRADGSSIENASLEATIDMDDVGTMTGLGSGEDVCATVDAMGISCVTCPDGSKEVCLDLYITDMEAELDSGFSAVPC